MTDNELGLKNLTGLSVHLSDGLGYQEVCKIVGNVQEQLNATGQEDLSDILERVLTLIKIQANATACYLASAQIVTCVGCDFENNIWSFEIDKNTKVSAGKYAVFKLTQN